MKEPFIHEAYARVSKFGESKLCKVKATEEALDKLIDGWFFTGKDLLWIERPEDQYASHHFTGKEAVKVTREDFLKGRSII